MRITFFLIVLMLAAVACKPKSDARLSLYMQGQLYRFKGDMKKAIECFEESADEGTVEACIALGDIYYKGEAGKKDLKLATKWYSKGADKGNSYCSYSLGYIYLDQKEFVDAVTYFKKAARKGNEDSCLVLGNMYEDGDEIAQDLTEAVIWFTKGSVMGHEECITNLGLLYLELKRYQDAITHSKRFATQGHADSCILLGDIYQDADGVEQDLKEAEKWYKKSTLKNDIYCNFRLGTLYSEQQLFGKAVSCFTKAANRKDLDSVLALGYLYLYDLKDPKKSERWFLKGARKGDAGCICGLGHLYREHKKFDKAISCFEKAAAKDESDAFLALGSLYSEEEEMPTDLKKAEEWYRKGIELNSTDCIAELAWLLCQNTNSFVEAETLARRAISLTECPIERANVSDTLGWALYKQGKYELSSKELTAATDGSPNDPSILDHLGDVKLKLNDKTGAEKCWKNALKLCEDEPKLKKILQLKLSPKSRD